MPDFLSRLAERTLGRGEVVRSRVAPLFAAGLELAAEELEPPVPVLENESAAAEGAPSEEEARRPAVLRRTGHVEPPASEGRSVPVLRQPLVEAPPPTAVWPPLVEPIEAPEGPLVPLAARSSVEPARAGQLPRDRHAADRLAPAPDEKSTPGWRPPVPQDAPPVSPTGPMADGPRAPNREALSTQTPTVKVTIGRIDVHAVFPEPVAPKPASPVAHSLSLDDYLKQRREGMR